MVYYSSSQLDAMFHAMADPTRRNIVQTLSRKPQTISNVAKPYNISLPAISKHIKVLEKANLLQREKRGRENVISLNPDSVKEMSRYLSFYQDFWNDTFENLDTYLQKRKKDFEGGEKVE